MTYAPHSKDNSSPQHQQQTTKATAQTFSDNRESTAVSSPLQAMMANSPQQQKLKSAAQLMISSPAQQKLNASAQNFANKSEPMQRMEDEVPLQGKFETESEPAQLEAAPEAPRPNNTGLPDNLKAGIENLSGMSMDHVKVHYNSDKPAQLQAHAYAQGSEIHVAPGQEKHLPHEAWHVVQQAQGRVRPTMQMKMGVPVNDDVDLESIVVQRRPLTEDENKELEDLKRVFENLNDGYRTQMTEIEKILTKVGSLPYNFRYLTNRMESTLRPLAGFMAESISLTGLPTPTSRILYRLKSRHKWYTLSRSGAVLVKETLDAAKHMMSVMILDAKNHVKKMESRQEVYTQDRQKGLGEKERRKNPNSISYIENARTDALLYDPEQSTDRNNWTQVDDNSSPNTKFINMYHSIAMVMLENYRDKSKGYFASDALFSQWMRATGKSSLLELPDEFPSYFYRNHIDNKGAREAAESLLGENESVRVTYGSKEWQKLESTDNVKSTMNILADYNKINLAREGRQFRCLDVLIYKGPTLKFHFGPA